VCRSYGPPKDEDDSMWANLMRARDEHGRPIEGDRLMSAVAQMFVAAIDTASTTILVRML
jgi:cytochrome P450